jgi:hypothetical protein
MLEARVIRPRDAAKEADTYDARIYWAISRGYLKVRREGGRTFILRDSFERWRRRLEDRRRIRSEELELVNANTSGGS